MTKTESYYNTVQLNLSYSVVGVSYYGKLINLINYMPSSSWNLDSRYTCRVGEHTPGGLHTDLGRDFGPLLFSDPGI